MGVRRLLFLVLFGALAMAQAGCETEAPDSKGEEAGGYTVGTGGYTVGGGPEECDDEYEGACVPPHPPDVDCPELDERDFDSIGDDPHGLDADADGVACESF